MSTFAIKKDTLLPVLEATLTDEFGDPIDLTGSSSVVFRMKRVGETDYKVSAVGQLTDPANGVVTYTWSDGDTDEDGEFEGEWVVTKSGKSQVFPGDGYFTVKVTADDRSDLPALIFCTAVQARAMLGRDVDRDKLALAQTILSMRTGIQPDASTDSDYDLLDDQDVIGLRQATAFQAVWLEGQPDFFTRLAVTSESVDGESRTYADGALELAPMARWALSNTRFVGGSHRTIDAPPARIGSPVAGWIDMVDNNAGWKPYYGDEFNDGYSY